MRRKYFVPWVSITNVPDRLSHEGPENQARNRLLKETGAMQYLLLIYDKEADWNKLSEADQAAVYKE